MCFGGNNFGDFLANWISTLGSAPENPGTTAADKGKETDGDVVPRIDTAAGKKRPSPMDGRR